MIPPVQGPTSRQGLTHTWPTINIGLLLKGLGRYLPVLFTLLTIALWTVFTAWVNTGQFGDNIEQFNWAHGPGWGYWKHPPLPTLMLACVIALFGNGVYWAYCLSALCFMGTAFLTWKIAAKLLGGHAGAVTVILLGLHYGFSWRAQIYNHNTVLLLMVAATVWATLLAVENKSGWRWAAAGCLAGLALLAKYQAIVPIIGLLYALHRTGALSGKENSRGLGLALLAATLVLVPHVLWLWTNDFPTLEYAKRAAQDLDAFGRGKRLFRFLTFQLRTYLSILITLGLVVGYFRFKGRIAKVGGADIGTPHISAWMWGLIGVPAICLALMVVLGGVSLESHWGLQTFQFACLWLVWRLKASVDQISVRYFFMAALLAHAIGMGLYYQSYVTNRLQSAHKHFDRIFPAQALADQATSSWHKATHCPLKYVVGPAFEAGVIALYSGGLPAVQEEGEPERSPWVKAADVAASGAIQVWAQADNKHAGTVADGAIDIQGQGRHGTNLHKVYWHIILPQQPCALLKVPIKASNGKVTALDGHG